ncbi:MAG: type I-B CRISPR-associated endonuclease Cas1 [Cytophagales bacterium]|nr:MAG: type I-B CRISPR-associated endonuclease Cas1 [Cytophagales bacterium]
MKTYYLFNDGRISRKDNTLKFLPTDADGNEGQPKYIPIEDVSDLYAFGALDMNSAMLNFLGKNNIAVHFFDYYEHYTGSFMPKDYLLAGKMQIEQTKYYISNKKRFFVAQKFVEGAALNMLKNLNYYNKRDKDVQTQINKIETHLANLKGISELAKGQIDDTKNDTSTPHYTTIQELMGLEGNIRQTYYEAFETIIQHFEMGNRTKQPPSNEINALISFGNMMCYTACLGQIYHTQLNPTISFLHEPGYRRYSLALDLAEIFKPMLVDRVIFTLLNKKQIQEKDFDKKMNGCFLKESGKKTFIRAWDEKLKETIKHRTLNRHVSYKHLIRLECYKLAKHILAIDEYKPFVIWW